MSLDNSNINIVSDDPNEILPTRLPWLLRWGIPLIFVLLIFVLYTSRYIGYPDIVNGDIMIVSSNKIQNLVPQAETIRQEKKEFVGVCFLNEVESKRVKLKQNVSIKLFEFSSIKYRTISGTIKSIYYMPDNRGICVVIQLKETLVTTNNQIIPFDFNLKGKVQIVTHDISLMSRILMNFNKIFERKYK